MFLHWSHGLSKVAVWRRKLVKGSVVAKFLTAFGGWWRSLFQRHCNAGYTVRSILERAHPLKFIEEIIRALRRPKCRSRSPEHSTRNVLPRRSADLIRHSALLLSDVELEVLQCECSDKVLRIAELLKFPSIPKGREL